MPRLLLTLLAALSTLLLLPTLYLWPRSHGTADAYTHTTSTNQVHAIWSNAGAVHIVQTDRTALGPTATASSQFTHTALAPGSTWHDPYANFTNRIEWSAAGFALLSGEAPATLPLTLNATTAASGTIILSGSNMSITQPTVVGGSGAVTLNSGSLTFTGLMLGSEHHQAVVLPYWFLAILFAAAPALWLLSTHRRRRLRKRLKSNHCQHCNYDLRASTDRCPECGTAISGTRSPSAGHPVQ